MYYEVRDLKGNLLIESRTFKALYSYGYLSSNKPAHTFLNRPTIMKKLGMKVIIKQIDKIWERKQTLVLYTPEKKENKE